MIELYAKGTTEFSKGGIRLHPREATVTFQENGRFDLDMAIAADSSYTDFNYGQILKASVPAQHVDAISLGMVSYWTVVNAEGSKLYSELPKDSRVWYSPWSITTEYAVGTKVSHNGKNYQCTFYDETSPWAHIAPPTCSWWQEIASGTLNPGKVEEGLAVGGLLMKTGDYNSTYMQAISMSGKSGYIAIADCEARGDTEERIIPARDIRTQLFVITEIVKEQKDRIIRITAEHVSYQLGRTILGDCQVAGVNPATAVLFIKGAMKEAYPGEIYTNVNDVTVTGNWSWKNAQNAILDPKAGLLEAAAGKLIRDNYDWFVLADPESDEYQYAVRYGANMRNVKWTGSVDGLITRVYPTAQREDGETLLLPEEHIDTVRDIPFVRPEVLNTGLKVGAKEKDADGEEHELTEEEILTRMRQAAQNRFTIDKVDMAEVSLDLEWQHMPDTEEYAQYTGLRNAAPGDRVQVVNGPLGISLVIRMTGYSWDPVAETYKATTFGTVKTKPTVSSYNLKSGSVTAAALGRGAVGSLNIQEGTITAREIEANSITADKIASRSIVTELLAANAVTADEINAGSVTAEKIAAHVITSEHIQTRSLTADTIAANAITAEKIASHVITSDHIEAGSLTSDTIAAGAITAIKIGAGAIEAEKIAAGAVKAIAIDTNAVTADKINAGAVTTDKLDAGAVTAGKIDALAVTTEKLAAGAVTADKINTGAVNADKIAAGSISAGKIDTTDLEAINATLGTASIADARIALADIDYAHIKDLAADTAIFETSITEQGVADRLYINRLLITYGQMVEATIGDLVIGASDGNYYHVDVEWDQYGVPALIPTQVTTPSAAEIEAGHTSDGKTIIGNVGTFAELSSEDFYAINGIIDRITAKRIDVDQLFAREATIGKINALDLSSNTYIQSTVGNWSGASTITQTINSINTRISTLGYGTFFYSETEPSHENLVIGDVWIEPIDDNTWADIGQYTWDEISTWSWDQVAGQYRMYVWTGQAFKLLFDNMIVSELQTEIQQNAYAITLKADESLVDTLSDQVTEFGATLEVQAEAITSAVSAVNAKVANYVQLSDPADDPDIHLSLGDTWTKVLGEGEGTWDEVGEYTWDEIAALSWDDIAGATIYTWTGTGWVETSNIGTQRNMRTEIQQSAERIGLLAEETLQLGDDILRNYAELSVQSDRITAEVARARDAETGLQQKTRFLQTSGMISLEAFTAGSAGTAMGVISKAGIEIDGQGKISINALSDGAKGAINKAANITVDGNGKILLSALATSVKDAINKAANIEVDADGKILLTALTESVKGTIDKAAGIAVDADGKILLSAFASSVQSAVSKAADIEVDGNGKIKLNALTTDVKGAITKAAGITVDANGKITMDAFTTDVKTNLNKAAGITVDSEGKIKLSAMESSVRGAVNKAANITVDSEGKILLTALAEGVYKEQSDITITSSGVDITGNKHINLNVNNSNYVRISSSGIDMAGSRVMVNGKSMWARDDIIVLKNGDNEQAVINSMAGKHDWVMIKPYYNAEVDYAYSGTYQATTAQYNPPIVIAARTTTGNVWLADGSQHYEFQIAGLATCNTSGVFAIQGEFRLSNSPTMATYVSIPIDQGLGGQTGNFGVAVVKGSGNNLSGEGSILYFRFVSNSYSYTLTNVRIVCKADTANSRVPCTTYYFP